jgi:hypothetical protein
VNGDKNRFVVEVEQVGDDGPDARYDIRYWTLRKIPKPAVVEVFQAMIRRLEREMANERETC